MNDTEMNHESFQGGDSKGSRLGARNPPTNHKPYVCKQYGPSFLKQKGAYIGFLTSPLRGLASLFLQVRGERFGRHGAGVGGGAIGVLEVLRP